MKEPIEAVGVWFYATSTRRYLYLMRSGEKHRCTWSLPGGKVETNESLLESLQRECLEEMNVWPKRLQLTPLEKFTSPNKRFVYHTFFAAIEAEFTPILNDEHLGYSWIESGHWPRPLHPGLWSTINFKEISNKIQALQSSLIRS